MHTYDVRYLCIKSSNVDSPLVSVRVFCVTIQYNTIQNPFIAIGYIDDYIVVWPRVCFILCVAGK